MASKEEKPDAAASNLQSQKRTHPARNMQLTAAAAMFQQQEFEAIFQKKDSMFERMRLEGQVAAEVAAAREAQRQVQLLKKQVEALSLEAASRPTMDEFEKQRLLIASLSQQMESHQGLLEQTTAQALESKHATYVAQEQARQLSAEAAAAKREAQADRQAVQELEANLAAMAITHSQQLDGMRHKSAALITGLMQQPAKAPQNEFLPNGSAAGVDAGAPPDELQDSIMRLLSGLYSGDISEEDAAKQLVSLNCELQVSESQPSALVSEPEGPPSPDPYSDAASAILKKQNSEAGAVSDLCGGGSKGNAANSSPIHSQTAALSPRAAGSPAPMSSPSRPLDGMGALGSSVSMGTDNSFIMSDPQKLMRLIERAAVIRQGHGKASVGQDVAAASSQAMHLPQTAHPVDGHSNWSMRLRSLGSAFSGGGAKGPDAHTTKPLADSNSAACLPLVSSDAHLQPTVAAAKKLPAPKMSGPKPQFGSAGGALSRRSSGEEAGTKLSALQFANPLWDHSGDKSSEMAGAAAAQTMTKMVDMEPTDDSPMSGSREVGAFNGRRPWSQ